MSNHWKTHLCLSRRSQLKEQPEWQGWLLFDNVVWVCQTNRNIQAMGKSYRRLIYLVLVKNMTTAWGKPKPPDCSGTWKSLLAVWQGWALLQKTEKKDHFTIHLDLSDYFLNVWNYNNKIFLFLCCKNHRNGAFC